MLTTSHTFHRFATTANLAIERLQGAIDNHRRASDRRRTLRILQELRDRDPRLFAETRVDPADLPPPARTGALFPPSIIAGLFEGPL